MASVSGCEAQPAAPASAPPLRCYKDKAAVGRTEAEGTEVPVKPCLQRQVSGPQAVLADPCSRGPPAPCVSPARKPDPPRPPAPREQHLAGSLSKANPQSMSRPCRRSQVPHYHFVSKSKACSPEDVNSNHNVTQMGGLLGSRELSRSDGSRGAGEHRPLLVGTTPVVPGAGTPQMKMVPVPGLRHRRSLLGLGVASK